MEAFFISPMANIILFDDESRDHLLPLTYTRPVGELRVGILTIKEKWEHYLEGSASYITQEYLGEKFPIFIEEENYVINGGVLPNERLVKLIKQLDFNEALLYNDELIATKLKVDQFDHLIEGGNIDELAGYDLKDTPISKINKLWHIFQLNGQEIEADFKILTKGKTSQAISSTNKVINPENIFIEEGAEVECAILSAKNGPIYIGKNAQVMEGCMIRGGLALCDNAVLKMGAKIYGPTTIGPHSKIGGEVNNSVIIGYSNKAHDGFIGNSILGEWCNLGADTNTSNLKNNYAEVKLWNYPGQRFEKTNAQFCGLVMGDHSKCGINTMFNTGSVVGVSTNVFGDGYPRNFIPSFCWGGTHGFTTYRLDKAMEVAEVVMKRRSVKLSELDESIMAEIFKDSTKFRSWEN